MKAKVDALVTEINATSQGITQVLAGLVDDFDKIAKPEGNNRANARISNALMEQSTKLKDLAKKCYAVRMEVVEFGKEKKAVRAASGAPKPTPPKPKSATPPPPPK
jgi:hypothetical protein